MKTLDECGSNINAHHAEYRGWPHLHRSNAITWDNSLYNPTNSNELLNYLIKTDIGTQNLNLYQPPQR